MGEEGERTCEQMVKDLATSLYLIDPHLYVSRPFDQRLLVQNIYFLRYNIVPLFLLKNSKYEVILHF